MSYTMVQDDKSAPEQSKPSSSIQKTLFEGSRWLVSLLSIQQTNTLPLDDPRWLALTEFPSKSTRNSKILHSVTIDTIESILNCRINKHLNGSIWSDSVKITFIPAWYSGLHFSGGSRWLELIESISKPFQWSRS